MNLLDDGLIDRWQAGRDVFVAYNFEDTLAVLKMAQHIYGL